MELSPNLGSFEGKGVIAQRLNELQPVPTTKQRHALFPAHFQKFDSLSDEL